MTVEITIRDKSKVEEDAWEVTEITYTGVTKLEIVRTIAAEILEEELKEELEEKHDENHEYLLLSLDNGEIVIHGLSRIDIIMCKES